MSPQIRLWYNSPKRLTEFMKVQKSWVKIGFAAFFGFALVNSVLLVGYLYSTGQFGVQFKFFQDGAPDSVVVYSLLAGDNIESRYNVSRITQNRERYVKNHANHFHFMQRNVSDKVDHPIWQKVEDAKELVYKYDWVWLLDASDAYIVNGSISIIDIVNQAKKLYPEKEIDIIISKDCTMINCGSFIISGSKWSQYMVQYWRSLGQFDKKHGGFRDAWFREQDALNHIISSNFMNAKDHTAIIPQRMINAYAGNTCGQLYQPGDFVIHEPNNGAQRLLDIMKNKNITEF
jgi:hypothetical protein